MSAVIELASILINQESITPNDNGCQEIIAQYLKQLDFNIEHLDFVDTKNLWAKRHLQKPLVVFAGHTDVVPAGELCRWNSNPFNACIKNGFLYGRGAADMKSSIAAMLVATKSFITKYPKHKGSIAFLITSDEEGAGTYGTKRVIKELIARQEVIDMCLVGEPSSSNTIGDVIKNGRRGSLNGEITIKGIQGHVAYPHLAKNPIHLALSALDEIVNVTWDNGNEFFPPTSLQIANLSAGTGATNVIPGELNCQLNLRYSNEISAIDIQNKIDAILKQHNLEYTIKWQLSGEPFLTKTGSLIDASIAAIKKETNISPKLLTTGGTSDGRFIAPTGAQVIELGPVNSTIHKVNECVKISDLKLLVKIYFNILENLLGNTDDYI